MSKADYHYTLSVLSKAVNALAVGRENLKGRLQSAMISLTPIHGGDFPPNLRSRFEALVRQCNKNPSKLVQVIYDGRVTTGPSGTLAATIPYMRWERAEAIAQEIVSLESELRWLCVET